MPDDEKNDKPSAPLRVLYALIAVGGIWLLIANPFDSPGMTFSLILGAGLIVWLIDYRSPSRTRIRKLEARGKRRWDRFVERFDAEPDPLDDN